ncbi:PAS domain-containing sensor histidine kinase [Parabacteroides bouchesdurhonensis]|uniref:PAS domain-containing sensor histidine kinase n=1 Tax=Parabacteroides bouchesdurhonensis TaxID=1936995 RepID=UPI000E48636C|nr:PAS domain-containing sensor histidine kinase [Parabacteroides bouchesdurhonensis]RHJ91762.1 PAS domain-containing sensor histidine kinase [Bacteroides sp. AM07-16]
MEKYDSYTRNELIARIECLEVDLEKAGRVQDQRKINFLNILMETILSNIDVAICVKDVFNGFKCIYYNQAAERFLGVKISDAIGKTDFEIFSNSRRAHEIRTEDYYTIKNERSVKYGVEYEKPNGEIRVVNIVRLLITNPDPGASPLLLAMITDVTEQRQNEIDLLKAQESDKLMNAFIANMSHEIRTPLNAIVGFSRLLTEADNLEERKEFMSIINNNCDLLLQLIDDILVFSKLESGTFHYNQKEVELRDICQEVCSSQSLKITSSVKLLYDKENLPSILLYTDAKRVEQVLLNLLSNAIKCTSEGQISLTYKIEKDFVRILVIDTGIGIPEEKQKCVFERFIKLDSFKQGTGLGLSICKTIVEKLGGEIGVISKYGEGSTFWFTLPLRKYEEIEENIDLK